MFGVIIFVPLIFQGVLGLSATSSGTFLTPMMLGLVGASMVTGQLMIRIARYHYLGVLGMLVCGAGFYILSTVTLHTATAEVTAALIVVGIGLGVSFPLYITAVQSAVEPKLLGVVSSNSQFWRNVGGTIATAIFGSILANRLPINIRGQIAAMHLPPRVAGLFKGGGSAQQLFSSGALARQRAHLPPADRHGFDQLVIAIKAGLAQTLHDLFLLGLVAIAIAAVVALIMPDVPLRPQQVPLGEAPPVPGPAAEVASTEPA
jgi:MFS family permease